MKLFVVLALVSFTGCQSNVLRSDEPKPQLDYVKDAFWEYFVKASQTAIGGLKTIGESKLAQQVNDKIIESEEVVQHYREIVVFISEEFHKRISGHVERLSESLKPDVNELRAQLEPLTEKLEANIQQQMQKVRQVLDPYTESLDTERLSNTVREIFWKLFLTADSSLAELRDMLGPSTKDLKEKVEESLKEIWRGFWPLIDHSMSEGLSYLGTLDDTLSPYLHDLGLFVHFLKFKLTALWESSAKIA